MYDKNYGNVYGVPPGSQGSTQAPPSWGVVPLSSGGASGGMASYPSSSPLYGASPQVSQDYYPEEYTQYQEYQDPVEYAKEKIKKLDKKAKKQERKRKQKVEDAKTAAETLIGLGVWNAIMWVVPCFGNKWYVKMFNGFGINFTKIYISLFTINVNIECSVTDLGFKDVLKKVGIDKEKLEQWGPEYQICSLLAHMNGHHSLQAAKTMACALPGYDACYIMSTLWWTSYMLIFAFAVSAITSLFGSMFLYYYWYVDHLKVVRNWALGFYASSPFLGVLCFAFYNVIAPDVGDLPRTWTAFVSTFNAGTKIGAIEPIGEDVFWNKFGWCWFFMYLTIGSSLAGPLIWGMWFIKHSGEDQAETAALEEEVAMEEKIWQIEEQADYLRYGIEPENAAWGQGYGATEHGQPQYQGYAGY